MPAELLARAASSGSSQFVDLHGLAGRLPEHLTSRRVYAVTPAQVQQMAAKYIQADKATIVVVGDTKVIADQIKPYEAGSELTAGAPEAPPPGYES